MSGLASVHLQPALLLSKTEGDDDLRQELKASCLKSVPPPALPQDVASLPRLVCTSGTQG